MSCSKSCSENSALFSRLSYARPHAWFLISPATSCTANSGLVGEGIKPCPPAMARAVGIGYSVPTTTSATVAPPRSTASMPPDFFTRSSSRAEDLHPPDSFQQLPRAPSRESAAQESPECCCRTGRFPTSAPASEEAFAAHSAELPEARHPCSRPPLRCCPGCRLCAILQKSAARRNRG